MCYHLWEQLHHLRLQRAIDGVEAQQLSAGQGTGICISVVIYSKPSYYSNRQGVEECMVTSLNLSQYLSKIIALLSTVEVLLVPVYMYMHTQSGQRECCPYSAVAYILNSTCVPTKPHLN